MPLRDRHCTRIPAGTPPLAGEALAKHMSEISPAWEAKDGGRICRQFVLPSFRDAIGFVAKVAGLAEAEDHHPDILIQWKTVTLNLSTHSIGGISENDLILAAKVDALAGNP